MTHEDRTPPGDDAAAPAAPAGAEAAIGSDVPVTRQLQALREAITGIDTAILDLLARRRQCAIDVARAKAADRRSVRDQEREQDLLVGLIERGRAAGLDAHYVTRVFHSIIDDSIRLQQSLLLDRDNPDQPEAVRVAFQGDKGSYSHVAICQHFASRLDRVVYLGFDAFAEVVKAVESGRADYAMLPIENTTSGGINEVYDLLMHTPLSVIGEETVAIDHCLLAHPAATIETLTRVYAHPQGFAQCSNFVAGLRHCRLESLETAEAVRRAAADAEQHSAAIASEQAGTLYGLTVLARGIANQRENVTRFLCIGRQPRRVPLQIACKSSLVMATSDAPGSLVEALQLFREAGISITKLESRPIIGNPWEEMFYLDVESNIDSPEMRRTLERLTHVTRYLKVLGCYPITNIPATDVAPARWVGATAATPRSEDAPAPAAPRSEDPPAPAASRSAGAAVPGGAPSAGAPAPAAAALEGASASAAAAHATPPATPGPSTVAERAEPRTVRIGRTRIGPAYFTFIIGPCRVDSPHRLREDARVARELGARVLALGLADGGAATGDGADTWQTQLDWLREAGEDAGLATMATVTRPEQVGPASVRTDALRIDGRHMEHEELLRAVGRTARPVLLTRGSMSTIDDLLHAAALINAQGNRQVMLCESGIRTFEAATPATLDVSAIALLRERCTMPILVDPLPALGRSSLVLPLVLAARAAGAAGCVLSADLGGAAPAAGGERPHAPLSPEGLASVITHLLREDGA